MKKLALMFCLAAASGTAFAQGLVNFNNSPTTLTSFMSVEWSAGSYRFVTAPTVGAGNWLYGLLIAPPGTVDPSAFTFSGAYATNLSVSGRFSGGNNVQITGWAAGASMSYEIAIWPSNLGPWQAGWLHFWGPPGPFGLSAIATGIAGGSFNGQPPLPTYNLFGGATGIQCGFTAVIVPEPSSMPLACLSAAAVLLFRRARLLAHNRDDRCGNPVPSSRLCRTVQGNAGVTRR